MNQYLPEGMDLHKSGFSPDANFPVINTEKGMLHMSLNGAYCGEGLRVKEISVGERPNVVPGLATALIYGDEALCEKIIATAGELKLDVTAEMADGMVKVISTGIPGHAAMPESTRNATGQMLAALLGCYQMLGGIGICGRCNLGGKFVCLDGPVFTQAQLNQLPPEM